jgi:hypothetical protein
MNDVLDGSVMTDHPAESTSPVDSITAASGAGGNCTGDCGSALRAAEALVLLDRPAPWIRF